MENRQSAAENRQRDEAVSQKRFLNQLVLISLGLKH